MNLKSVGNKLYTFCSGHDPVLDLPGQDEAHAPPEHVPGTEPEPATVPVQASCLAVLAEKLNSVAPDFGSASATRHAGVGAAIGGVALGTATGVALVLGSNWTAGATAVTTVLGAMFGSIVGGTAGCIYPAPGGDSPAAVQGAQP